MKINAEVVGLSQFGDTQTVKLHGKRAADADWRPVGTYLVDMPISAENGRTFYVGRKVEITVRPK